MHNIGIAHLGHVALGTAVTFGRAGGLHFGAVAASFGWLVARHTFLPIKHAFFIGTWFAMRVVAGKARQAPCAGLVTFTRFHLLDLTHHLLARIVTGRQEGYRPEICQIQTGTKLILMAASPVCALDSLKMALLADGISCFSRKARRVDDCVIRLAIFRGG
jgi:hypothetical protein